MTAVKLFVEGGSTQSSDLDVACRRAFSKLLGGAGLKRMPRIVASGSRGDALRQFETALRTEDVHAVLLVDSEGPIAEHDDGSWHPWDHVRDRPGDGWVKPAGATDDQLHFMVQCMESWFLADPDALADFYGQGFQRSALPARPDIENVDKQTLFASLENATRKTKTKGSYDKGRHSFALLAKIDPSKVRAASRWASRFFGTLDDLTR